MMPSTKALGLLRALFLTTIQLSQGFAINEKDYTHYKQQTGYRNPGDSAGSHPQNNFNLPWYQHSSYRPYEKNNFGPYQMKYHFGEPFRSNRNSNYGVIEHQQETQGDYHGIQGPYVQYYSGDKHMPPNVGEPHNTYFNKWESGNIYQRGDSVDHHQELRGYKRYNEPYGKDFYYNRGPQINEHLKQHGSYHPFIPNYSGNHITTFIKEPLYIHKNKMKLENSPGFRGHSINHYEARGDKDDHDEHGKEYNYMRRQFDSDGSGHHSYSLYGNHPYNQVYAGRKQSLTHVRDPFNMYNPKYIKETPPIRGIFTDLSKIPGEYKDYHGLQGNDYSYQRRQQANDHIEDLRSRSPHELEFSRLNRKTTDTVNPLDLLQDKVGFESGHLGETDYHKVFGEYRDYGNRFGKNYHNGRGPKFNDQLEQNQGTRPYIPAYSDPSYVTNIFRNPFSIIQNKWELKHPQNKYSEINSHKPPYHYRRYHDYQGKDYNHIGWTFDNGRIGHYPGHRPHAQEYSVPRHITSHFQDPIDTYYQKLKLENPQNRVIDNGYSKIPLDNRGYGYQDSKDYHYKRRLQDKYNIEEHYNPHIHGQEYRGPTRLTTHFGKPFSIYHKKLESENPSHIGFGYSKTLEDYEEDTPRNYYGGNEISNTWLDYIKNLKSHEKNYFKGSNEKNDDYLEKNIEKIGNRFPGGINEKKDSGNGKDLNKHITDYRTKTEKTKHDDNKENHQPKQKFEKNDTNSYNGKFEEGPKDDSRKAHYRPENERDKGHQNLKDGSNTIYKVPMDGYGIDNNKLQNGINKDHEQPTEGYEKVPNKPIDTSKKGIDGHKNAYGKTTNIGHDELTKKLTDSNVKDRTDDKVKPTSYYASDPDKLSDVPKKSQVETVVIHSKEPEIPKDINVKTQEKSTTDLGKVPERIYVEYSKDAEKPKEDHGKAPVDDNYGHVGNIKKLIDINVKDPKHNIDYFKDHDKTKLGLKKSQVETVVIDSKNPEISKDSKVKTQEKSTTDPGKVPERIYVEYSKDAEKPKEDHGKAPVDDNNGHVGNIKKLTGINVKDPKHNIDYFKDPDKSIVGLKKGQVETVVIDSKNPEISKDSKVKTQEKSTTDLGKVPERIYVEYSKDAEKPKEDHGKAPVDDNNGHVGNIKKLTGINVKDPKHNIDYFKDPDKSIVGLKKGQVETVVIDSKNPEISKDSKVKTQEKSTTDLGKVPERIYVEYSKDAEKPKEDHGKAPVDDNYGHVGNIKKLTDINVKDPKHNIDYFKDPDEPIVGLKKGQVETVVIDSKNPEISKDSKVKTQEKSTTDLGKVPERIYVEYSKDAEKPKEDHGKAPVDDNNGHVGNIKKLTGINVKDPKHNIDYFKDPDKSIVGLKKGQVETVVIDSKNPEISKDSKVKMQEKSTTDLGKVPERIYVEYSKDAEKPKEDHGKAPVDDNYGHVGNIKKLTDINVKDPKHKIDYFKDSDKPTEGVNKGKVEPAFKYSTDSEKPNVEKGKYLENLKYDHRKDYKVSNVYYDKDYKIPKVSYANDQENFNYAHVKDYKEPEASQGKYPKNPNDGHGIFHYKNDDYSGISHYRQNDYNSKEHPKPEVAYDRVNYASFDDYEKDNSMLKYDHGKNKEYAYDYNGNDRKNPKDRYGNDQHKPTEDYSKGNNDIEVTKKKDDFMIKDGSGKGNNKTKYGYGKGEYKSNVDNTTDEYGKSNHTPKYEKKRDDYFINVEPEKGNNKPKDGKDEYKDNVIYGKGNYNPYDDNGKEHYKPIFKDQHKYPSVITSHPHYPHIYNHYPFPLYGNNLYKHLQYFQADDKDYYWKGNAYSKGNYTTAHGHPKHQDISKESYRKEQNISEGSIRKENSKVIGNEYKDNKESLYGSRPYLYRQYAPQYPYNLYGIHLYKQNPYYLYRQYAPQYPYNLYGIHLYKQNPYYQAYIKAHYQPRFEFYKYPSTPKVSDCEDHDKAKDDCEDHDKAKDDSNETHESPEGTYSEDQKNPENSDGKSGRDHGEHHDKNLLDTRINPYRAYSRIHYPSHPQVFLPYKRRGYFPIVFPHFKRYGSPPNLRGYPTITGGHRPILPIGYLPLHPIGYPLHHWSSSPRPILLRRPYKTNVRYIRV